MFTGIVEEIGTLWRIGRKGEAMVLTIGASKIMDDVALGDSIAINGVCLTVTAFNESSFHVDVTPQTYRHTNLKLLQAGSPVNLERAMKANGRFGGHIVQGHVDGVGTILKRVDEANAVLFQVRPENGDLFKYMIPQGSVTLDGISLTIADIDDGTFTVSIIPHTLAETVLQHKKAGDTVNMECDVLGKYVEHLLGFRKSPGKPQSSRLTEQFLTENGFL
ncbi:MULTISPECIES: riboflavin synthase [unclassified Paenibacillus]|uniref:riboflavin synthase n=1 Tax=unclassified Paenibacillus TaxID=185978 RepID=UPI001C128F49|nr:MULTISPECIES: riboflavin synthase [unclassified Paenibacillus]MBU5444085.1 riboflavin synthase [Paenibacillus sp. MSJ-34]CAH0118692.1 Riboflavin synthase [Paenibacillus sp. CECT 9249]